MTIKQIEESINQYFTLQGDCKLLGDLWRDFDFDKGEYPHEIQNILIDGNGNLHYGVDDALRSFIINNSETISPFSDAVRLYHYHTISSESSNSYPVSVGWKRN